MSGARFTKGSLGPVIPMAATAANTAREARLATPAAQAGGGGRGTAAGVNSRMTTDFGVREISAIEAITETTPDAM